jgi:hypothetical protein
MVEAEEIDESMPDRFVSFYWNWFPVGHREFSVWLGAYLHPSIEVPEKVRVAYVADFSVDGEPETPLEKFVLSDAPLLIYPYIREAVGSLTSRGFSGSYSLPMLDVREIIAAEFRFAESTGTEMLRDDEEAENFGFAVALPAKSSKRKTRAKSARRK